MRKQIAFKSSMHMLDVVCTENFNPDVVMARPTQDRV
jgi:hypothetical protein